MITREAARCNRVVAKRIPHQTESPGSRFTLV